MDTTGPMGRHAAEAGRVARLCGEQARQRRDDAALHEAELEAGLVAGSVQAAAARAATAARAAEAALARSATAHERGAEAPLSAADLHERAAKPARSRGKLDLVDRHESAAARVREAADAARLAAREDRRTLTGLTRASEVP